MSAEEIRCELCAVYSQTGVSEGNLRQYSGMFKDGRIHTHVEGRSFRKAIGSE